MRKTPLINGEIYHVYNRGVDKRNIFSDTEDLDRFFQSFTEFNTAQPIGSIYENSFRKKNQLGHRMSKLVDVIAYCINPNHYHLLLRQVTDKGIEKFMQRLANGYTKYFNNKVRRSGVLFQGKFKSIHVKDDYYLLHLSAYINLNFKVHQLGHPMSKLVKSSWSEYVYEINGLCKKDIVLKQFKSVAEYKKFALSSLKEIKKRKDEMRAVEFDYL